MLVGAVSLCRGEVFAQIRKPLFQDVLFVPEIGNRVLGLVVNQRLLKLCPMAPSHHWLAAKSPLRTHQLDRALAEFRRLLELDPTYAADTWSSFQAVQKPDSILQKVLADSADVPLEVR
jgi:hypothetical protein